MEKRKIRQRRILSKEKRMEGIPKGKAEWRKKEEKELRNLRNPEEIWRRINREERRNGEITI